MLKATQPSQCLGTANAYFTTGGSGRAEMIIDMRLLKPLERCVPQVIGLQIHFVLGNAEDFKLSSRYKASAHICTTSQACYSNLRDKQNKG